MNPLLKLKQFKKENNEGDLILLHHKLMRSYGWIPLEEFKNLPIPALIGLNEQINKEDKQMEMDMKKGRRR